MPADARSRGLCFSKPTRSSPGRVASLRQFSTPYMERRMRLAHGASGHSPKRG